MVESTSPNTGDVVAIVIAVADSIIHFFGLITCISRSFVRSHALDLQSEASSFLSRLAVSADDDGGGGDDDQDQVGSHEYRFFFFGGGGGCAECQQR